MEKFCKVNKYIRGKRILSFLYPADRLLRNIDLRRKFFLLQPSFFAEFTHTVIQSIHTL